MKDAIKGADEWDSGFEFTEEEKRRNLGSSDFFGLNHYMSSIVKYNEGSRYNYTVPTNFFFFEK